MSQNYHNNQVQENATEMEEELAAKFLSYPIPSAIVEEWEKVKYSPAFVGLFYLSANHIKFTYLIKD